MKNTKKKKKSPTNGERSGRPKKNAICPCSEKERHKSGAIIKLKGVGVRRNKRECKGTGIPVQEDTLVRKDRASCAYPLE